MNKQATKPHRVVVQKWGLGWRADLLFGTTICETGYGHSQENAFEDLRQKADRSAWREAMRTCPVAWR